jgi:pimeloyl-ACP methyl ester carboxylesterase
MRATGPQGRQVRLRTALQLSAGLLLLAAGFVVIARNSIPDREQTIRSGGCTLSVHTFEPRNLPAKGSVFLVHGLAASEKIMDYYTRGFVDMDLRVIVPDLPGHGGSPGPFSPLRAETCSEALLAGMMARAELDPARTILAGHSLGGAIALRIAARRSVAGVIAVSPAPMLSATGISPEMLLYGPPERLPSNSLILNGGLEPGSTRRAIALLVPPSADPTIAYRLVPGATHASLLLDAHALHFALDWAARTLNLSNAAKPNRISNLGFLAGLLGLLLLVGPLLGAIPRATAQSSEVDSSPPIPLWRILLEAGGASSLAVGLLRLGVPFQFLGLYNGNYFASFLFLVGVILLLLHARRVRPLLRQHHTLLLAAVGLALGLFVSVLFSAWLRFTITTVFFGWERLWRLPLLVIALFPCCAAEEVLLLAPGRTSRLRRLAQALAFRFVAWLAVAAAFFFLHSGQVLVVLMVPYFAVFSFLNRLGMDLFRAESRSAAGTALFGAILSGVFCLLVFPLT